MQLTDIAGTDLMIDDPHHHKQGGLKCTVGQNQDHTGLSDLVLTGPKHEHQESKLADGPVGQEQLEVILTHRSKTANHHGDCAH